MSLIKLNDYVQLLINWRSSENGRWLGRPMAEHGATWPKLNEGDFPQLGEVRAVSACAYLLAAGARMYQVSHPPIKFASGASVFRWDSSLREEQAAESENVQTLLGKPFSFDLIKLHFSLALSLNSWI